MCFTPAFCAATRDAHRQARVQRIECLRAALVENADAFTTVSAPATTAASARSSQESASIGATWPTSPIGFRSPPRSRAGATAAMTAPSRREIA